MVSRIPPSRRDAGPDGAWAAQRAIRAVSQQTPGTGRVAQAAPVLSSEVRALLRGKAAPGPAALPIYLEAIIKSGAASVATNVMPPGIRVPASTTLREVHVRVGTAPTGSALTVLVKRSGSTLATVNVAAAATSGSSTGLSTALADGDVLTFDISAVGSSVAGSDVAVAIEAY